MLTVLTWVLAFFRQFRGYLALIVLSLTFGLVYVWMTRRVVPRWREETSFRPVRKAPAPDPLDRALGEVVREVQDFTFLFGELPSLEPNPCEGRCVFRGTAKDAWEVFRLPPGMRLSLEAVTCAGVPGVEIRLRTPEGEASRRVCLE